VPSGIIPFGFIKELVQRIIIAFLFKNAFDASMFFASGFQPSLE
jgi:hypothetical protein